ncbi:hypothetical protein B0H16DRAFT_1410935 [Mycena metata]|uniref:RRM domain-containing protein n=1 Tax=Mycena metata TaxID=1033252 RepID=A0AAD7JS60_9AGAR|nr:hypothetical protein B0H16DRAFT_1410935 [Mycena metata]
MSLPATTTKRLHISFSPSVPSKGTQELVQSLTAHFGKFGSVKSVDGLGELDGVGVPKKFGFVSIEGSDTSIARCVNSLSGSVWKGVKVRVGDARPTFDQRIAEENAEEPTPPKRKRKRGVHAEDMAPVAPETAATRSGWSVSETGTVARPVRIRPERPLPPPLVSSAIETGVKSNDSKKSKKTRDPDSRARRRTIDMTRYGSVHLTLENSRESVEQLSSDKVIVADESHIDPSPASAASRPKSAPITASSSEAPQSAIDLAVEKSQSLTLLNSLFGARDGEWAGRESVGSDVDEEELLKIGTKTTRSAHDEPIEFVPMDVENEENSSKTSKIAEIASVPRKSTQATKLKDLFISKEDEVEFSLLGYLDLELDEELPHPIPTAALGVNTTSDGPLPAVAALLTTPSQAYITLDPKQLLFFPLLTSFSSSTPSTKARQRDVMDVSKDNGWDAHFHRTETDDEIRVEWETRKVGLTREWNRRWREAGKVRRRRGGVDGE